MLSLWGLALLTHPRAIWGLPTSFSFYSSSLDASGATWGPFLGAPGTAIPPPAASGATIPGHLGDPRMEERRIPHPKTPCHSAGSRFGEVEGGGEGWWGGVNLHGDTVTTVAMARLRGPARCHGDAPGTTSRHGDGRWMERSLRRGPGPGWGRGSGDRSPAVGPRGAACPPGARGAGAVCRRVPPPPGFICTRLFHSSSHYHLTSPTSHFQSNHSTALIAHANMQIRIN